MRMTHRYLLALAVAVLGFAAVIIDPSFLRGPTGLPSGMFAIAAVAVHVSFWLVRFRRRGRLDEREAQMFERIDNLTIRWLLALLFLVNLVIWIGYDHCWALSRFINSNWLVLTVLTIVSVESTAGLVVFRED
jgi:cytochrome bd-type quinol oxidase subunit 2